MKQINKEQRVKSQGQSNLARGGINPQSISLGGVSPEVNNLMKSLKEFTKQTGAINQEWGEQKAMIDGNKAAQRNYITWTNNISKLNEINKQIASQKSNKEHVEKQSRTIKTYPSDLPDTDIIEETQNKEKEIKEEATSLLSTKTERKKVKSEIDSVQKKLDNGTLKPEDIDKKKLSLFEIKANLESDIDGYMKASQKYPTINLYEITRLKESARLQYNNATMHYVQTLDQMYQENKDNPAEFNEQVKNFTDSFMENISPDYVGQASQAFNKIKAEVGGRVYENFLAKQHQNFIVDTKNNISEGINYGGKIAKNGGDFWGAYDNIKKQITDMHLNNVRGYENPTAMIQEVEKEFRTNEFEGKLDRELGLENPNPQETITQRLEKGQILIDSAEEFFEIQPGEDAEAYNIRLAGLTPDEQTTMLASARKKLLKVYNDEQKAIKLEKQIYKEEYKEAYEMMAAGKIPKGVNLKEMRASSYRYGDATKFNEHYVLMEADDMFNQLPMDGKEGDLTQQSFFDSYALSKSATPLEKDVHNLISKSHSKNKSLKKSDPYQLMIDQGMYSDTSYAEDPEAMMSEWKSRVQGKAKQIVQYGPMDEKQPILSNKELDNLGELLTSDPMGAMKIIKDITDGLGSKESGKIMKQIYPKNSTGIIYAANKIASNPVVGGKILHGLTLKKQGTKLSSDETKDLKAININNTLDRLGVSAKGIKQAIEGYFYGMDVRDAEKAITAVTNGIDGGIMVYKPGLKYNDVVNNMEKLMIHHTGDIFSVAGKQRLNGEPLKGYDDLKDNFDDYKLVSQSSRGYAFKHKETGDYLLTNKLSESGRKIPLIWTFKKED